MTEDGLLEFVPQTDRRRAKLTLCPDVRGRSPVSRLLYGKFCEHLGYNIYQGMSAQVLYNPTFGTIKVSDEAVTRLAERLGWSNPRLPAGAIHTPGSQDTNSPPRKRGVGVGAENPLLPGGAEVVLDAYRNGGALGWFPVGPAAQVRLSPDAGPHGSPAQRVETAAAGQGVGQWTHLPTARTRGYQFRLVARSVEPARLMVALHSINADGSVRQSLAGTVVELSSQWGTFTGRLLIAPAAGLDPDAPLLVSLTTDAPANVVIGRVLLYPDDHVDGADPVVLRYLREAKLPILRWPGGNFVSAFDWRDGVGPVDARPTYPNPVWQGVFEPNLFGTDEFIAFCRNVGCEPMICVNAGNGTAELAAAWVEYCNGSSDTPMGCLRAENGHPEPFRVKYWEIGNEIFGRHQVGWTTPAGNVDRYNRFSEAMLAVDPSIRLLACGGLHLGVEAEWNRALIAGAPTADCHTHHILEGGEVDETINPAELFAAFMGYPIRVGQDYRRMRQQMLDGGIARPRLAITEMQLFAFFKGRHGEGCPLAGPIPTPTTISEALYLTLIIHESIRLGELMEMIAHTGTVNHGGGLRKLREKVSANPVHYAQVMGVDLAGGTPVGVRLECGAYDTVREFGHLPIVKGVPDLDAVAVAFPDGRLKLMIVNRSIAPATTRELADAIAPGGSRGLEGSMAPRGSGGLVPAAPSDPIELMIDLAGLVGDGPAEVTTLAGESFTDENTRDQPERIVPRKSRADVTGGKLHLTIPPFSLTRVDLKG